MSNIQFSQNEQELLSNLHKMLKETSNPNLLNAIRKIVDERIITVKSEKFDISNYTAPIIEENNNNDERESRSRERERAPKRSRSVRDFKGGKPPKSRFSIKEEEIVPLWEKMDEKLTGLLNTWCKSITGYTPCANLLDLCNRQLQTSKLAQKIVKPEKQCASVKDLISQTKVMASLEKDEDGEFSFVYLFEKLLGTNKSPVRLALMSHKPALIFIKKAISELRKK